MSFVNVYEFVCVLHPFLAASRNVNVNKCVYKCASLPFGYEERFDSHNDIPQVAQRNVSIVAHKAHRSPLFVLTSVIFPVGQSCPTITTA